MPGYTQYIAQFGQNDSNEYLFTPKINPRNQLILMQKVSESTVAQLVRSLARMHKLILFTELLKKPGTFQLLQTSK